MQETKRSLISYRPAAYFQRQENREEMDIEGLREINFRLISEVELLRKRIRELGFIPPKFHYPDSQVLDFVENPITPFQQDLASPD